MTRRSAYPSLLLAALLLGTVATTGCGGDDPAGPGGGSGSGLFINEILASNTSVLSDPDFEQYGDWVELFNGGDSDVDLGGWSLTDDRTDPSRWRFPEGTTIGAGGFLLVWADGADTTLASHHAPFRLSAGGEEVALYDESLREIDAVAFGPQTEDVSFGRSSDGGSAWATFAAPTPNSSNSGSPPNRPPVVRFAGLSPAFPLPSDGVEIRTVVTDDGGAAIEAFLVWSDGPWGIENTDLDTLDFVPASGDTFSAVIPSHPVGTVVSFYVTAVDGEGARAFYPADAPLSVLTYTVRSSAPTVFINEFLASNRAVNADPDFQGFGDWIELYNGDDGPLDLTGWFLTDDFEAPDKWGFPAGASIAAGGFLLVFADDGDRSGAAHHTNFKLSAGGERIGLFDGSLAPVDTLTFGAQSEDVSYGRATDGGGEWRFFDPPTPGAANE